MPGGLHSVPAPACRWLGPLHALAVAITHDDPAQHAPALLSHGSPPVRSIVSRHITSVPVLTALLSEIRSVQSPEEFSPVNIARSDTVLAY